MEKKQKYNKCAKCGKKKRRNYNILCIQCANAKTLIIDENLTPQQIIGLVEEIKLWINKLEVKQKGMIDLFDINQIITYHDIVFNRDYIGLYLSAGQQLSLMYNELKKFTIAYST